MRSGRINSMLGVLLTILSAIASTHADWPCEPEINVPICTAAEHQAYHSICTDNTGGYFIVWTDLRNTATTGEDIYMQRIDSNGNTLWPDQGIPLSVETGFQQHAAIVADGFGNAIVVWKDSRASANSNHLYAQKVDGAGNRLWNSSGLPIDQHQGNNSKPIIIPDGIGGVFVAWTDFRNGAGESDVFAQRINAAGSSQWYPSGEVVCDSSGEQLFTGLVSDLMDGIIVVWLDNRDEGSTGRDIYAQRLNPNGNPLWTINGIPVCQELGDQGLAVAVSDDSGGVIVVWTPDIRAQRVAADGSLLWDAAGELICNVSTSGLSILPNNASGAFVIWRDYRDTEWDIYAQQIDADGNALWTVDGELVCGADSMQHLPTAILDDEGGIIVAWADLRRGDAYNNDLYIQKINASGAPMWEVDGVPVCLANGIIESPTMASDGANGAVVIWKDDRNTQYEWDVFAQRVFRNGHLCASDEVPSTSLIGILLVIGVVSVLIYIKR